MFDGHSTENLQYWHMLIKQMWFPTYNSYIIFFRVIANTKTYWTTRSCDHCYPSICSISMRQLRSQQSTSEWQRRKCIQNSSDKNGMDYELLMSNTTGMRRETTAAHMQQSNVFKKKHKTPTKPKAQSWKEANVTSIDWDWKTGLKWGRAAISIASPHLDAVRNILFKWVNY